MWPPMGSPLKSKFISMYLPNLLELSFLFVLALPKLSRMAFDFKRMFFTLQNMRKFQKKLEAKIKIYVNNMMLLLINLFQCTFYFL